MTDGPDLPDRPAMSVAELQAVLDEAMPGGPKPYVVEAITPATARVRLRTGHLDGRPGGTVSGPTLMALADCTAWMVIIGQIGPLLLSVTTSFHIDFLRKPDLVDVVADATLLKLGRRLAVADVLLSSASRDEPVAKAQVTYSIPPR
jgi:acyl-coenzyme A thioesterase PaaI-like protein